MSKFTCPDCNRVFERANDRLYLTEVTMHLRSCPVVLKREAAELLRQKEQDLFDRNKPWDEAAIVLSIGCFSEEQLVVLKAMMLCIRAATEKDNG